MQVAKPICMIVLLSVSLSLFSSWTTTADNQVMGELQFSATDIEKDSGAWIDGQYVGYMGGTEGEQENPSSARTS